MSRYVKLEELRSIDPLTLQGALTSSGWREVRAQRDLFQVLESPDSDIDILIPLNTNYRDYLTRMNEALVGVEEFLGEGARLFLAQLVAGPMDELLFDGEMATIRGSVKWRVGERIHEAAHEAFRAAAKSCDEHLPYFGNRGIGVARRYVDAIRMGQTREGSYIVTALVPISSQNDFQEITLPGLEPGNPGFYRSVTANLMQAAQVAIDAAEEYSRTNSFGVFLESVDYGVSSELTDAMIKFIGSGYETRIRAEWSPLVQRPVNTPEEVRIAPNHKSALGAASTRFKEPSAVTKVTVTGTVRGLDRPKYGEAGVSRIDVLTGSRAKRLRVRLSREQYDAAIDAHRAGLVVRMTGEQSRARNLYWLYNVRDIEIIPPSENSLQLFLDEADDGSELRPGQGE